MRVLGIVRLFTFRKLAYVTVWKLFKKGPYARKIHNYLISYIINPKPFIFD